MKDIPQNQILRNVFLTSKQLPKVLPVPWVARSVRRWEGVPWEGALLVAVLWVEARWEVAPWEAVPWAVALWEAARSVAEDRYLWVEAPGYRLEGGAYS